MEEIFQSLIRSKQQLSDVRIFHNPCVAAAVCMKKASNMTHDIIVLWVAVKKFCSSMYENEEFFMICISVKRLLFTYNFEFVVNSHRVLNLILVVSVTCSRLQWKPGWNDKHKSFVLYISVISFGRKVPQMHWTDRVGKENVLFPLLLIFSRPYWVVRSRLWSDVLSVCRLSVTFCIVAKRMFIDLAAKLAGLWWTMYIKNIPNIK